MTKEKLQLNRKFLVIESPIPFEIYCPEQDDGVKRRQGSWQMTIHDLLTKSHYPLNPIYNLELIYDETLLGVGDKVTWYTTDLNLGEALRGIDGQLVTWNFEEQLNVNDFQYNNGLKNTRRKYFDNFFDLYEYLNSIDDIKVVYNCSFYHYFITPGHISNIRLCDLDKGLYFSYEKDANGTISNKLLYKLHMATIESTMVKDIKALSVVLFCMNQNDEFERKSITIQIENPNSHGLHNYIDGFFELI